MNPQDALWHIPNEMGNTWLILCAICAMPAAVMMLLRLIINEPFSLLTLSRAIIVASLVAFGMAPLNSGWLPWGVMLASVGGLMASILLVTGWCTRTDQTSLPRALWNWATGWRRKNGGLNAN